MGIWIERWREWTLELLVWIEGMGWVGWLVFWVLFVVSCILWLPGSLWTVAAGAIYGVVGGVALILICSVSGSIATLWMGRYGVRPWVERMCGRDVRFQGLIEGIEREGVWIVFLARLSPILPSSVMNYGLGLTKLKVLPFAIASGLGALPSIVVYVYLGSVMGELLNVNLSQGKGGAAVGWLHGVGLLAAMVVTWRIAHIARDALKMRVGKG
ncbi:MAG: TVP38/TMEM64 family protein [Methylacidiphilales bacterium]|nr:TVP38/TMEM64 family protein [Candidatus Methylacidiphilales bacterium]MDW8349046.1 TVP38/TMEM64 family protein [Verrucomicrobiae bacterium]